MEGEGENSNNPNSWIETNPPLTANNSCFFANDNFSYQQLLNNHNPSPLFHSNDFYDFSTIDGEMCNHIEGVSELIATTQDQTNNEVLLDGDINVDQNQNRDENFTKKSSSCDVQSNDSSDGAEKTDKGSSSAYWIKGQWTTEEDRKLVKLVKQYGYRKWAVIAEQMVGRIGKQCRERWQNHLRPDIKKDVVWTEEEERLIIEAHEKFGNKWAEIAKCVPGRSENSIKNHWNATKRKQTSKRKIKRPERLGPIQSYILEEYIKKKYFNKGSSINTSKSTNNNPQSTTTTGCPLVQNNSLSDDDESTTYNFTLETFDEEMNFMKNLFTNNENSDRIINASDQHSNIISSSSSSNFSISTQTIDVQPNVGDNLLASSFSSSENSMVQIGGNRDILMQEGQGAYFSLDINYLYSYMFEGSFGNMGSNMG